MSEWSRAIGAWTLESERRRSALLADEASQVGYLVARALLRLVAAATPGVVDPRTLVVEHDAAGKPTVPAIPQLSVSISHQPEMVVVGACLGAPIGVDIESAATFGQGSGQVDLRLAQRMFDRAEVSALRELDDEQRRLAMLRYWTLKEAAGKALGVGIERSLRGVVVELSDSAARIRSIFGDESTGHWSLRELWLDQGPSCGADSAAKPPAAVGTMRCAVAIAGTGVELTKPQPVTNTNLLAGDLQS